MDLYLILFAIAALGILALTLIAWGRVKQPQRGLLSPSSQDVDTLEEKNTITTEMENNTKSALTTGINVAENEQIHDPALASLGFSALDGLLVETESVPKITALDEPISFASSLRTSKQKLSSQPNLIIFYLMAPSKRLFVGYELLQALLAAGLRFGDMNIFHYYEAELAEKKNVLFSVASAVEPGIFDMANMGGFSCPGLSLFMSISHVENPAAAFEYMLETARQLAEDLQGVLCDAQHKPLTDIAIESYRASTLLH